MNGRFREIIRHFSWTKFGNRRAAPSVFSEESFPLCLDRNSFISLLALFLLCSRNEEANSKSSSSSAASSTRTAMAAVTGNEEDEETRKRRSRNDWIRPGLRVRVIRDRGELSRYHRKKGVVESINAPISSSSSSSSSSAAAVTLRMDEDGKRLRDLKPRWLETVIPKKPGVRLKILNGKFQDGIGRLVQRDKGKEMAQLRLEGGGAEELIWESYDDICELAEDLPHHHYRQPEAVEERKKESRRRGSDDGQSRRHERSDRRDDRDS